MAELPEIKAYLARFGIAVWEFTQLTHTAETAAAAVGCSVAEIAKTLLFLVGGQPVAVVTCGDMKVKSSLLKREFGLAGKVRLPAEEQVERYSGYKPGGVCPFLLPAELPLRLDSSLERFPLVYAAAGTSHSAAPVTLAQLRQLTGAEVAELCGATERRL